MMRLLFWSVIVPLVESAALAFVVTRALRRRYYERGYDAGVECIAQINAAIFARGVLPLLRAKGATPGEIMRAMAITEKDVPGCGRPHCKACAKRPPRKAAN